MAKFTIEFGPKSEETLKKLADEQDATRADIVRRAIGLYALLSEQAKEGNKIMFKSPDGEVKEVITF